MTHRNTTETCCVPGCSAPVMVSSSGRVYKKCREHNAARYRQGAIENHNARVASKVGLKIGVVIVNWSTEELFFAKATVDCVKPMPKTHGDFKKRLAEVAQQGMVVAQPHPWKEEGLYADLAPDRAGSVNDV